METMDSLLIFVFLVGMSFVFCLFDNNPEASPTLAVASVVTEVVSSPTLGVQQTRWLNFALKHVGLPLRVESNLLF